MGNAVSRSVPDYHETRHYVACDVRGLVREIAHKLMQLKKRDPKLVATRGICWHMAIYHNHSVQHSLFPSHSNATMGRGRW